MTKSTENSGRHQGQFKPGQSGNPSGKPKGARNKVTLAIEALLDGEAEELTRKAIELAKTGDIPALRICLDRILPPRRDRPVAFELPKIESAKDAANAISAVLAAVSLRIPNSQELCGRYFDDFAALSPPRQSRHYVGPFTVGVPFMSRGEGLNVILAKLSVPPDALFSSSSVSSILPSLVVSVRCSLREAFASSGFVRMFPPSAKSSLRT